MVVTDVTVHPHACGELRLGVLPLLNSIGSSPRLWGTQERVCSKNNSVRFIPTPVGNSFRILVMLVFYAVHPHACGELLNGCRCLMVIYGSSPRLWGTHAEIRFYASLLRFIPTPVGNSKIGKVRTLMPTVHPHACGELVTSIRTNRG